MICSVGTRDPPDRSIDQGDTAPLAYKSKGEEARANGFSIAGDVVGNQCDVTWCYLPRLTSSPSRNEAIAMVKTRLSGIDMDRNTGPFFSITQICR